MRRFDPGDPSHVARDEGTGGLRLRGGALRFDDDGCSVYRIAVLDDLGLGISVTKTEQHRGLAVARAENIRTVYSGLTSEVPEFDVSASPHDPPPVYEPAHSSLLSCGTYESKSKMRRARDDLAAQAFDVVEAGL